MEIVLRIIKSFLLRCQKLFYTAQLAGNDVEDKVYTDDGSEFKDVSSGR